MQSNNRKGKILEWLKKYASVIFGVTVCLGAAITQPNYLLPMGLLTVSAVSDVLFKRFKEQGREFEAKWANVSRYLFTITGLILNFMVNFGVF